MNGVMLAIESSGDGGGAAVLRNGEVAAEVEVSGPRKHGSELMPCIDRALAQAKLQRNEIDVVAVNCGPGSYTGLRIGIATAEAIGFALGKPVIGVPCFDAMAVQYVMRDDFEIELKRELWPVLDARRNEVMTARMLYDGGRLERATGDVLVDPAKLHEQAQRQAIVFGSGVPPYEGKFDHNHLLVDIAGFEVKPSSVGLQAVRQLADAELAALPRKPVEPRYFRRVLAKTVEERARQPGA
ncbi:MAG: tRNA (adenosine(37)-N6)-threonylcarbamoyltransferase complex dimerization subunit type 1 TsaB [Planctomycetes bacterium]|nr:tRNA (adenosine(37)-N6)-threonylcarbamoyltransferase complex dimerization subunit type 1 TsaB [Planctomycetota bacterium]MCW8136920.1 tRNA (adenosine(37)-N6)-threonylcarbamoyltransferase complex dimerization subunit type 1 TsaB [Planctomycetota bacterium]